MKTPTTTAFDAFFEQHVPGYPRLPRQATENDSLQERQRLQSQYEAAEQRRLTERRRLTNIMVAYLFRRISSREMVDQIARVGEFPRSRMGPRLGADGKPVLRNDQPQMVKLKPEQVEAEFQRQYGYSRWRNFPESEGFRQALNTNGYFLRNLKVFIYYWIVNDERITAWMDGPTGKLDAHVTFWLDDELVSWIRNRYYSNCRDAEGRRLPGCPALTLETYNYNVAKVMELTAPNLVANVKHQYRWVITSHSIEDTDIIGELQAHGIRALYRVYPEIRRFQDAVNFVGKSMKNYGMNLYYYYSSPARQALVLNDEFHWSDETRRLFTGKPLSQRVEESPLIVYRNGSRHQLSAAEMRASKIFRGKLLHIRKANPFKVPPNTPDAERERRQLLWFRETMDAAVNGTVEASDDELLQLDRKESEGHKIAEMFGSRMDRTSLEFVVDHGEHIERLQQRLDYEAVMAASKGNNKQLQLLQLLTGNYDQQFSEYLIRVGVIHAGLDNESWQETASREDQVRYAAGFLASRGEQFSASEAMQMLDNLRKALTH